MNRNQEPVSSISARTSPTLREEIANDIANAQDRLTRLAKLEHTIPARWLDMTREQVWEKFGVSLHF